ncbi:MAG: C40 family peptidase [Alcaligenaceae bacterium]|nr:C40 family peptidase [Alcaligenaceae bacterium]
MPPHLPTSNRGIMAYCSHFLLAISCITLSNFVSAQNLTQDPIKNLIGTQDSRAQSSAIEINSNYSLPESNISWTPKFSDPIGDLITQAKQDRLNLDASISINKSGSSELAQAALNYLGVRYRFGGTAPSTGFDCSGFIYYTASKYMGVNLPRNSASMASVGLKVDKSALKPGDLVFFNTRGFRNSHVGIYVGANKFVHSPRTGTVVRVEDMSQSYWSKRYNGARRLDGRTLAAH